MGTIAGVSNSAVDVGRSIARGLILDAITGSGVWLFNADQALLTTSEMRFQEQKQAFMEIPPLLLEQYRGHFVASLNGRIVDHDSDYVTLVHRFFGNFGDVAAFITKIGERHVAVIDTPFID
jgi:hypothetical protein